MYRIKSKWLLWICRLSLGLAFVLSGIRKLPGVKFTKLPLENPVGLFFEGMYASGIYWNFIGVYQILIGFLLCIGLWPRLSPILSLPVTINIFLVSMGLQMQGTPIITFLMLLANLYLVFYEWKHYRHLFKWKTN